MPDHGRFMLEGNHFSWWMNDRFLLTVNSLFYGTEELRIESDADPERVAHHLAKQLLTEGLEPY